MRDTLAGCDGTIIFDSSTKGLSYQLSATYSLPAATKRRSLFLSLPLLCPLCFSQSVETSLLFLSLLGFGSVGIVVLGASVTGVGGVTLVAFANSRHISVPQTRRHQVRGRKGEYIVYIICRQISA